MGVSVIGGGGASGGGNDEGLELIASFEYDTTGRKIEQAFAAGAYQVTAYSTANSVVNIFTENSVGTGALLSSITVGATGFINSVISLGSGITKILVRGSGPGTFVMRKAPEVASGNVVVIPDYSSWDMTYMNTPVAINALATFGDEIIALPAGNTLEILRSTNRGLSWETVLLPGTATQKYAIVKSSSYWVISGYDSGTFRWWWSANGVDWTQGTFGNFAGQINVSGMAVNGNTVVAISQNYGSYRGWRSTDGGSSWETFNLPNNGDNYSSCSYVNGYWFAPGYNGPNLAYSTNGLNWSDVTSNVPNTGGTVGFLNGTYYLPNAGSPGLGGGSSNSIHVSTNVTSWTTRSLPLFAYWGAVHVFDGTLILSQHSTGGNSPGSILTSADGTTWSIRSGPNIAFGKLVKQTDGPLLTGAWQRSGTGDRYVLNSGFSYEVN